MSIYIEPDNGKEFSWEKDKVDSFSNVEFTERVLTAEEIKKAMG